MSCKGICIRYKAPNPKYVNGQTRCQICNIFLQGIPLICHCCNYRVRSRPRNAISKRIYLKKQEMKK